MLTLCRETLRVKTDAAARWWRRSNPQHQQFIWPISLVTTGVLISPWPGQEGNKLGSMSRTRAISTTSRDEMISHTPPRQGKASKEIHAFLTETLACFLPGRLRTYRHPCYILSTYKTPKEIHAILTETLVCFLPGQAKDLSAPLSTCKEPKEIHAILTETHARRQRKFTPFWQKH